MNELRRRLIKMEQERGIGRLIVFTRPNDMTDEQLEAHLLARGISIETDDLAVSLQRFSAGDAKPWVSINGEMIA